LSPKSNTVLSDDAVCVIQILENVKEGEKPFKIIITNKRRDTQMSGRCINIDECFQHIELYLIRNKPSLSFNYFKENLAKYKKEVVKNDSQVEESENVKSIEVPNEFFSDINPPPSLTADDVKNQIKDKLEEIKTNNKTETETVVETEEVSEEPTPETEPEPESETQG